MLAFFGALPVIGNLITAFTTAMFNAKVKIAQARMGADRDAAVAVVKTAAVEAHEGTARLSVIAGNAVLTWLVVAFAAPFVIFIWKIVVYDIVLDLGSTAPIKGQVADWGNTIIISIFGSATSVTLGRLWFANRAKE